MSQRKISECINVRINVGNYQHIELTKYAEESIEYNSEEERISKEDQLRDELLASLVRSMHAIPEKLGKGIEEAIEVEEAIQKAIPEWLENGPVPNIANTAEKKQIQAVAEQKAQKDEAEANLKEVINDEPSGSESDEDLFEEDEMPEPEAVEKPEEAEGANEAENVSETKEEAKSDSSESKKEPVAAGGELEEFFEGDDEDLFGDL
jgi:hypothetical protein